ncbi:beta-glucosidase [Herbiconiux sp. VKM Ac-1786]|uniref:GH1 family beta-glucosidase n=1 Tax=Herbiconiux sp. VKM Ac-1786 TaxID=2783824 RepID=UPI00188C8048|nr:GH1 family beta-glucosidase [Herbiconiux sp. VKM Ac-1786]MBF4571807.1 beta-glucosidase [Herbiconiux sp. VKM Ac-1786]
MTLPELSNLPEDFIWGVATAAYQIEGAVDADGRGPSIWDVFSHTPGRTKHGDDGDIACDHRTYWRNDLELIASLDVPAYRLSLSWPRLQPGGTGQLNAVAVRWYRDLLATARSLGIAPYVTLYHWDLPQELEDQGGWPERRTAELFGEYSRLVADALGDLVEGWITVNEAWCASFLGYGAGVHAPGRHDLRAAVAAAHHLNLAHGYATAGIRSIFPRASIGVTNIIAELVPADRERDADAVARLDAVNHQLFLAPVYHGEYPSLLRDLLEPYGFAELVQPGDLEVISAPTDFAGVNHYQRVIVSDDPTVELTGAREVPAGVARTSFDWSITPDALTRVLQNVAEYTDLPIYITENGASFTDNIRPDGAVEDPERVDYLTGYLGAIDDAIAAGVDVRGYFAWSLLDNFEWAEGYEKRFGLVFVEFGSQRRVPKRSAAHYTAIIRSHRDAIESRTDFAPAHQGASL